MSKEIEPEFTVRDLIISWRGVPTRCDFCGRDKPTEELHPEECGEWICNECIKRIGYGGDPIPPSVAVWWCNSHGREATHIDKRGEHCCDPKLGGILLPCRAILKEK